MTVLQIAGLFLGSSALGSVIVKLLDIWLDRKKRKDTLMDKEDKTTDKLESLENEIKGIKDEIKSLKDEQAEDRSATRAVAEGQKVMLKDKLVDNAQKYIDKNSITFSQLEDWHKMHDAYHALGGNGDLNILRDKLDKLPIVVNKYIQEEIK